MNDLAYNPSAYDQGQTGGTYPLHRRSIGALFHFFREKMLDGTHNFIDARNPLDYDGREGCLLFATSMIWRFIFPYDSVFRMIALFMSRYIVLIW